MNEDVLVSVVIPARNEADRIGAQLDALADQVLDAPWEVVVVDNGSTDGTAEVAAAFHDRLPGLLIVDEPDAANQAQARNAGAAVARGRLLVHADADDMVGAGWLGAMVDGLAAHDLVSGPIDVASLNPPGSFTWRVDSRSGLPVAAGFLAFASSSNLGVRREVFDSLGGFDGSFRRSADVEFSWRAQLCGHTLGHAPGALVHRRLRPSARGLFRQHFGYGEAGALLYARYRDRGMPRPTVREVLHEYGFLIVRLYRLRDPAFRRFWMVVAGRRAGRVVGALRYRVPYF